MQNGVYMFIRIWRSFNFSYKKRNNHTGIRIKCSKETLERVLRLIDVLEFINTDTFLKNKLALKVGTAINLTFFDYLRLSVDIDLHYVGSDDREQMIIDKSIIETKILNYMQESNMQYRSDKTKKTHALDSFVFNYSNLFNAIDMIKVEINYMCHYYEMFHFKHLYYKMMHI